jgi:hypothetical protein
MGTALAFKIVMMLLKFLAAILGFGVLYQTFLEILRISEKD